VVRRWSLAQRGVEGVVEILGEFTDSFHQLRARRSFAALGSEIRSTVAPYQVGQALFGHHPGAALRTATGRDAVLAHINGNRGAFHHNADVQVFEPAHILWLTFYHGPCLRRSGLPA